MFVVELWLPHPTRTAQIAIANVNVTTGTIRRNRLFCESKARSENIAASKKAVTSSACASIRLLPELLGPPELEEPPELDEKNPASAPMRLAAVVEGGAGGGGGAPNLIPAVLVV
jgi:hypothetical protein